MSLNRFQGEFTKDEQACLDRLVDAWNAFVLLPCQHPDEQAEFRHKFHELQRIIMTRPTQRALGHVIPAAGASCD